ncbi:MAG TPA: hypothetical protein VHE35_08840 [Kofleriaceae bacterium]|nr:hypothetical protein [Kofleriaceae bacterium]
MSKLRTFVRAMIGGAIVLGASVAAAPAAHADTVTCSIIEIEASTADAPSIDAGLKPLEKKLKKPPFSSWNSFKQLGSQSLSLETLKPSEASLVHGKATLILREMTAGAGKKTRLSLGISLDDDGGKRVLDSKVNVDANDYFVVGRSLPANKGHLVALTCTP